MSRLFISFSCVFFIISYSFGQDKFLNSSDTAIVSYDEGNFAQAVNGFEMALGSIDDFKTRGVLLYNLGNAHFKSENYSGALASYLSSRSVIPRDPELKSNLATVIKTIKDDVDSNLPVNSFSSVIPFFEKINVVELNLLFSVVFLIFCLCALMIKNVELRKLGIVFAFCAFFVGAGGYILSNLKSTYELQYGVAKIDELAIKSSPGAAGIELFKISKGTPVIITAEAGPYFKIKMPQLKSGKNLQKGWVSKDTLYSY